MPNLKNQKQLDELNVTLGKSKAMILANYAGLSVPLQNELRANIATAGGRFTVAKNTLLKIALKQMLGELPADADKALEGQTAVLFVDDDPVTPAKALVKFAEDHELPEIKMGVMDGKVLTIADIKQLSKLPGKQELLGQLVGQLNAPVYGFAQVLRANLQNVVFAVDAIRRSREA